MISHGGARHRRARRRRPVVLAVLLAGILTLAGLVLVRVLQRSAAVDASGERSVSATAPDARPSAASTSPAKPSDTMQRGVRSPTTRTPGRAPSGPAVHTPQGLWWGVDSTLPISAATIANVRHWYRGAPRPQFWGRYLSGSYGVTRAELAYAREQRIYVYLIVSDRNCSHCEGGDLCGHDKTTIQAHEDATAAADAARRLGLPAQTTLFKDIEQVSSCRGEPTTSYLLGWYHSLHGTGYRTGFYGNVHKQFYDFPVAYCHALALDTTLGTDAVLAMNEDELRIGAPRGSTGPHNAPRFAPKSPTCAPNAAVEIWQYGESLTSANLTDIDQARPDTPGVLAPDGTATP